MEKIPLPDIYPLPEAELEMVYGKIGQGKTYTGTMLTLRYLEMGAVVYTSYPIQFDGYDESTIWFYRSLHRLGLKTEYLVVPKENLHTFNYFTGEGIIYDWKWKWPKMNEDERRQAFYEFMSSVTDAVFIVDEAQFPFDSYFGTKMDIHHRMAILASRHFNRYLILIAQRPNSIHVTARAQIARFRKLEKISDGWWIIPPRFQMTEFQDTNPTSDTPKEDRIMEFDEETGQMMETDQYKYAENVETFFLKMAIANSYDSKYLRGNIPPSQPNNAFYIKDPVWWQKLLRRSDPVDNLGMKYLDKEDYFLKLKEEPSQDK